MTLEPGVLVLLVDDNADTLAPWTYFLRNAGLRVETAVDGPTGRSTREILEYKVSACRLRKAEGPPADKRCLL